MSAPSELSADVDPFVARIPLEFTGADLSADSSSQWLKRPPHASRAAIHIGCTATGSPVGVVSIKVGTPTQAVTAAQSYAPQPSAANNPTGTAWSAVLEIFTVADSIAILYDWTSGGTGTHWTDDTGVAGTTPYVEWS